LTKDVRYSKFLKIWPFYGDNYDDWEMTGISALLMNTKGAYRVPTDHVFSFMIYKEVIDLRN